MMNYNSLLRLSFLAIFLPFIVASIVSFPNQTSWVDANLDDWYKPWEKCILLNTTIQSSKELRLSCLKKFPKVGPSGNNYHCNVGGVRFGRCCGLDDSPSYNERPYLRKVIKNYEHPQNSSLVPLVRLLSKFNGSLITIGDSQLTTMHLGINCDIIKARLHPFSWNTIPNIKVENNNFHIHNYAHNNILHLERGLAFLNHLMTNITEKYSHSLIVFNIGTHYNEEADANHEMLNSRQHFREKIPHILRLLNDWASNHTGITMTYLETPPQHYDTLNGYFIQNQTNCVPIRNTSLEADWRNYYVYQELLSQQLEHITMIPIRDLMIPLYREHFRGNNIDCTHYCYWPMIQLPIYDTLYQILKQDLLQKKKLFL